MSLTLLSLECAISCDGKEMEMYAVQQEGPSALTAYVASEAGKVSVQQVYRSYHHDADRWR
jgi:hypothetical protein